MAVIEGVRAAGELDRMLRKSPIDCAAHCLVRPANHGEQRYADARSSAIEQWCKQSFAAHPL
jgi:hypothetical protein